MKFDDIKTPEELYEFMKCNIKYGFVSNLDNKKYTRVEVNNDELYEKMLFETYFLQTPQQLLKNGYGICYDQVSLAKYWLVNHGYDVITYYSSYHNHTILIYKDGNTYNLFERALPKYNSIYRACSLEEVLEIYKHIQFRNGDVDNIKLYKYDNISYGIGFYDFINECKKSDNVIELFRNDFSKQFC